MAICPSGAACAVEDVPSAIAASRHTNAQAKDRKPIIIFVNFVFIVVVSFCLSFVVLAFIWLLVIEESFRAVHISSLQIAAKKFQDFLLEDKNLGRPRGLDLSP